MNEKKVNSIIITGFLIHDQFQLVFVIWNISDYAITNTTDNLTQVL